MARLASLQSGMSWLQQQALYTEDIVLKGTSAVLAQGQQLQVRHYRNLESACCVVA